MSQVLENGERGDRLVKIIACLSAVLVFAGFGLTVLFQRLSTTQDKADAYAEETKVLREDQRILGGQAVALADRHRNLLRLMLPYGRVDKEIMGILIAHGVIVREPVVASPDVDTEPETEEKTTRGRRSRR